MIPELIKTEPNDPRDEYIHSFNDFYSYLKENGIPVESVGVGKLNKLFQEVRYGDSKLENSGGVLKRVVDVAVVDIWSDDGKYRLAETRQDFYSHNDELVESRDVTNVKSLSETKHSHETYYEAAQRGIREELGISGHIEIYDQGFEVLEKQNGVYPFIMSKYNILRFATALPREYFKREGYINIEPNSGYTKVFHEWVEI